MTQGAFSLLTLHDDLRNATEACRILCIGIELSQFEYSILSSGLLLPCSLMFTLNCRGSPGSPLPIGQFVLCLRNFRQGRLEGIKETGKLHIEPSSNLSRPYYINTG